MTAGTPKHTISWTLLRAVFDWLTTPSRTLQDPGKVQRARLLSTLLLVPLGSSIVILLLVLVGMQARDRYFDITLLVAIPLAACYALSRTRYYTLAAVTSILLISLATFALSIPSADPGAFSLVVYLIIPVILSSMLLSPAVTLALITVQLIGMIGFEYYFTEVSPKDNWLTYVVTTSLLILLSMVHHTSIEKDRQTLLATNELRYQALVELSPLPIVIATANEIILANPAAITMLGARDPAEVIGKSPSELIIMPTYSSTLDRIISNARAGITATEHLELQLTALNGRVIDAVLTVLPFTYKGEIAAQIIAVDMTGHKKAQAALQASEERFRLIAQVTNDTLYDYNLETGVLWCKNGQRRLLDEIRPDRVEWQNHIHSSNRAAVLADLEAAIDNPKQSRWIAEYQLLLPNGTYYNYVTDRAHILRNDNGQATRLIGAITDITEQKHAEQAEREQRTLAEALVDISTIINSTLELDSVLDAILKTTARVVPYDAASITLLDEDNIAHIARHTGFDRYGHYPQLTTHDALMDIPELQQMLVAQHPIIIDDTRRVSAWVPIPGFEWVRSHISTPIFSGDNAIGFLHLESERPHHFTPIHAQRLAAMVPQIAITLNNSQLYNTVSQHANELEHRVHERTAALRQTTERVEAILNNSSDAIVLTNANGGIRQANLTFDELLFYSPDELFDEPLTCIVAPDSVDVLAEHLDRVRDSGQKTRLEVAAQRRDGTTFSAEIGLSAVSADDGLANGIVCTLRDITPYKEAEKNLRNALQKERELGELKTRFVIMASHEFRTPLATIQATSDTLHHYAHRMTLEQREQSFNKIQRQIAHMTDLLDDILIAGRLEAGAMKVHFTTVNIPELLREIVADFQKGISTHSIIVSGAQNSIKTAVDSKLLRQVVTNLLSNATKYSPAGSPVHITYASDPVQFTISIADKGIGIPAEDQEHMFDIFHRGTNAGTVPGSGLGLAITRQAVDLHGGTVSFRSVEGAGTTFTITIPLMMIDT